MYYRSELLVLLINKTTCVDYTFVWLQIDALTPFTGKVFQSHVTILKSNNEMEDSVVLLHHIPYVGEHSTLHLPHVSELFFHLFLSTIWIYLIYYFTAGIVISDICINKELKN